MPNAILRAGPFATASNFFINPPSVVTEEKLPVNCAMSRWKSNSWKLLSHKVFSSDGIFPGFSGESFAYLKGPSVFDETASEGSDPSGFVSCSIEFLFRYQAAVAFDVKIISEASSFNSSGSAGFEISISNGGTVTEIGTSFSNEQTVTIQPSVLPNKIFRAKLSAVDASDEVSAILTIKPG